MSSSLKSKRAFGLLCAPLIVLGLSACGNTVTTSSFHGAEHEVAQTIANLQTDATAGEQGKICSRDLAASVVEGLKGKKGCEAAIKNQLSEIDSLELSVQSIKLDASGKSATAAVKSTKSGKKTPGTLALVKEGGKWKVAGL
jgi:hypothetical protein